jgi:HEAT repeat protein
MERMRPLVNAIWTDIRTPPKPGEEHPRYFWEVTDKLIALGPDVVPFLAAEIELQDPATFHFSAYALGRLGGKDAEVALRRSVRAADAMGGRFGLACKRFATYGLAIIGTPDVMDLMQTGESMHGVPMCEEYPIIAQAARMIGPPAAPTLVKQLQTFASDPTAADKLEDSILALGHAGDSAVVPKLLPFLSSTLPAVRVIAADAVSRLGAPPMCEHLLPLLASAEPREREIVADLFERWKPDPCYNAMVGRLEVEAEMAVRVPLYRAIVAMGGESALDVLRLYVRTNNSLEQAVVIDAIGRIGSKKGLPVLRSLLPELTDINAAHAVSAMAAIGGEGATDTIWATTGDPRVNVAAAARDTLINARNREIAPRLASELLGIVREPVGAQSLRSLISRRTDALVALRYTDPVDDLNAASDVQSDPEIRETLASGVRRLRALVRNGDDAAAWSTDANSSFADVRRLAYARLAEIGSTRAVKGLSTCLARTDLSARDRADILLAIAEHRTAKAASLVESHLADPAYDVAGMEDPRSAAAWAARRLGGKRMSQALRESALRRDGRDWATLVYLAVLEKRAAMDILKSLRARRLRYPESRFGREAKQLDGILADLAGIAPWRSLTSCRRSCSRCSREAGGSDGRRLELRGCGFARRLPEFSREIRPVERLDDTLVEVVSFELIEPRERPLEAHRLLVGDGSSSSRRTNPRPR